MPATIDAREPRAPRKNEAPPKVFSPEFLALMERLDGVTTGDNAERARPLEIVSPNAGLWHVLAEGSDRGPLGRFTDKELAVLYCAAYPTVDRDTSLELGTEPEDGWYPLRWSTGGRRQRCGELPHFDQETVDAMRNLLSLARNPLWLSYLLEMVGGPALEAAGDLLCARLERDGLFPGEGGAS